MTTQCVDSLGRGMTVKEGMYFLEWLWSQGYRYLAGDDFAGKFMICEKVEK